MNYFFINLAILCGLALAPSAYWATARSGVGVAVLLLAFVFLVFAAAAAADQARPYAREHKYRVSWTITLTPDGVRDFRGYETDVRFLALLAYYSTKIYRPRVDWISQENS